MIITINCQIKLSNNLKRTLSTVFYLFIFATLTYSQSTQQEKKSLKEVITTLEKQYQCKFTYADDIVTSIFVTPIPKELSLKKAINYLKKETGLTFIFLSNNFISINKAQALLNICGYISDAQTNELLSGVTVISKGNSTITDQNGYFSLKVSKQNNTIRLSYLGYTPIIQNTSSFLNGDCITIALISEIQTLSEISINNYLVKGIDRATDGTFNIDFTNFETLPGLIETDVLQTIQSLPGIQSVSETVSDINIRGGTNDQNLISWDGIKMYQSGHFFGLISIFNPQMTKSAKLIKNGTSSAFSDGTSGTILMQTDNKLNSSTEGSIGLNLINIDGFLDIPLGNSSSLQVSARKAINDFIKTPTYTRYFSRISQDSEAQTSSNTEKEFDFYDISFRWLYKISENDFLRVSGILVNNELLFNENQEGNSIFESKKSRLAQETVAASLNYTRNWSALFSSELLLTESNYLLRANNVDLINLRTLVQENGVSETSLKLNTFFKPTEQLSLLNGYQYSETGITNLRLLDNPPFKANIVEVVREHGIYSELNYKTTSNATNINVGLRFSYLDFIDKNDQIIEPRLSLHHKISTKFSIDVLGEFKHQNSSQIVTGANDFLGVEKRRWQLADLDSIPVLKSKQASIGLNYTHKGWLITTEGYYKQVDGITARSQGFLTHKAFQNVNGSYTVKGVDLLINKRLRKLSTWLTYTFSDNQYNFQDFQEIKFPNNIDIRHSVGIGTSFVTDNFKAAAGLNWHTGRPTTRPVAGNEITNNRINYEPENFSRINDYLRVDLSVMYLFKLAQKINAKAGLSIWNGFNKRNSINEYYRLDESNLSIDKISNHALELTPNFTFRVNF